MTHLTESKYTDAFINTLQSGSGIFRISPKPALRRSGPAADNAIDNAAADTSHSAPTLYEAEELSKDIRYDLFDVSGCLNNETVSFNIKINLTEISKSIKAKTYLVDKKSGQTIAEQSGYFEQGNTDKAYWDGNINISGASPELLKNAVIIAEAEWQKSKDLEPAHIFKANPITTEAINFEYTHIYPRKEAKPVILGKEADLNTIEKIKKMGPVSAPKDKNNIVVALWREPVDLTDVDYICYFGRPSISKPPYFGIPGEGKIYVPDGINLPEKGYFKATCYAIPCDTNGLPLGGGVLAIAKTLKVHMTQDGDISFSKDSNNCISYNFLSAWGGGKDIYDGPDHFIKSRFIYFLDMIITDDNGIEYRGAVRSGEESVKDYNFYRDIDTIAVMFGCIAAGTLIKTRRGNIPVEDVKIGDDLYNPKKQDYSSVTNTWKGIEQSPLLKITTADGEVALTKEHPVFTPRGPIRADKLAVGDNILAEDERTTKIVSITETGINNRIYNIDMKYEKQEHQCFLANNLIVGTNFLQNTIR